MARSIKPLPLKHPLDLAPELALAWPERVDVDVVPAERLVDSQSLFAADEKRWLEGKKLVVAEAELFPGTPDRRRISRRSKPIAGDVPSMELYRDTVNKLTVDVRRALETWHQNQAPGAFR